VNLRKDHYHFLNPFCAAFSLCGEKVGTKNYNSSRHGSSPLTVCTPNLVRFHLFNFSIKKKSLFLLAHRWRKVTNLKNL
jgi:hypothetical protein